MEIPSTVPKHQLFGVLHVRIDLTVFKEPARIKDVRIRIRRFVTGYRPFQYSISNQKKSAEQHCVPCVLHDRSTGGNHPLYTSSSINRCGVPEVCLRTYLTVDISTVRFLGNGPFDWNSYGLGGHPRERLQATWRHQQQPSHLQTPRKTYHSQTLFSPRTRSTRSKIQ